MNAIKTIKRLLEDLYRLYNYGNNGEMVIIDELDCFIYKGKELHYDQNLIMYSSSDGTIKIDGIEKDNSIINKSYIKIKENEEVKFDALNENSEEFNFLNNVIEKISNKLKSNIKHR